jgi:hypothetical protein
MLVKMRAVTMVKVGLVQKEAMKQLRKCGFQGPRTCSWAAAAAMTATTACFTTHACYKRSKIGIVLCPFLQAGVAVSRWAVEYEQAAADAFKLNNPDASVFCNNCNVLLRVRGVGRCTVCVDVPVNLCWCLSACVQVIGLAGCWK